MPLFFFEWAGTILALLGAFTMASKKIKIEYSYIIWIISNILYIYFFTITNNKALLVMNIVGIFINFLGMYQWKKSDVLSTSKMSIFILYTSFIFFFLAGFNFIAYLISFEKTSLEWFGSLLGLASAFLLAARHKYSFLCWFFWTLANCILIYVGIINEHLGFVVLQIGFTFGNLYGAYVWFKHFKQEHNLKVEVPTHS